MTTRLALIEQIRNYRTEFPGEEKFRKDFLNLLLHPRAFHRDHMPGHITGSAWIIDKSKQHTLLTHHAKLNKWLQPGGHADGDEDIVGVALREAREETGIKNFEVLSDGIFDLDIHVIPGRKEIPEHFHYDVRILLQAAKEDVLTITNESLDLQWFSISELNKLTQYNPSLVRMSDKVKKLV